MAYQLFAKGKEITAVSSSLITSTSQWSIPVGDHSTLSALSTSGFTLTNNFGSPIVMQVNLSLTNLVVGQTYTLNFTTTSTPAGGYIAVNFLLYGETNPDNVTFTEFSTSVYILTQEFTAVESSAIINFRSYNGADGDTYVGSNISVTTAGSGFNGVTELDVIKGSPFTLDFNFKDIKDLKTKGSHSYNFRLASSPANDEFFGSYFKVGSYYSEDNFSFNPFGMAECWVLKDTLEVFKGNMQLTNIYLKDKDKYEYECILYSSEVSFLDVIKGIKFNELNYTGWNHEATPSNIYGSYNSNSISNGDIVYSLWDYGIGHASNQYINYFQQPGSGILDWTSNSFDINKLRPQVRLKSLIDLVFETTGYTFKSDFFDSAEFLKIYMDLNYNKSESISTSVSNSTFNSSVKNVSNQTIGNNVNYLPNRLVDFPNEVSDESGQWNPTLNYWTCLATGTYTFTISGTITPSSTPAEVQGVIGFQLIDGWDGVSDWDIDYDVEQWFSLLDVSTATEFSQSITFYRSASSSVSNRVRVALWAGAIDNSNINWTLSNMKLDIVAVDVQNSDTNLVFVNNLFGSLSIEKWWKSILTKFNLVTIPNKQDPKQLLIEPYNDFADSGDTYDWSDKIDYKKDVQIIPPTKYCGKQVKFKDAPSNDYVYQSYKANPFSEDEPTYGEYIEAGIRNQFADKDTEFTTIFSPTINYPLNSSVFDLGVYSCAVFNINEDGIKKNTGGVRLSFFHGVKPLPNNFAYKLQIGTTLGGNVYNNYPFFSSYSEKDFTDGTNVWTINWKETLQAPLQSWDALPSYGAARKFWSDYILDNFNVNSRMLSASIRLTPTDIANFSFSDVITLMGQNYRVNSIKGYPVSSDGNSKVELLLVNKSVYIPTNPVNSDGGITTGENQIECDWVFAYQSTQTNILLFTTSTDSTPSPNIPEDCCIALGHQWLEFPNSVNGFYCFMTEFPDLPDTPISELRADGNQTNDNTNKIDGLTNTVRGVRNNVVGNNNNILDNTFNNRVEGNFNQLYRNINASFVYGDYNQIVTHQYQNTIYTENLQFSTNVIGGRISGNYGKLQITGDNVLANGVSTTTLGSQQKGEFIVNAVHLDNDETCLVGQYGTFDFATKINNNSIANINGFRFAGKSNITLKLELTGIIQLSENETYSKKAIINQTILISNYTNPQILYSNVDSSVIDSAFGATTIECYSMSKPPYRDGDGFVAFKISSAERRTTNINWTLSVKYDTTPLSDSTTPSLGNPTDLSGNVLWLDASNEESITVSGSTVSNWKDVSGNLNEIKQTSTSFKPAWTIDEWQRPCIDFDGISSNLNSIDAQLLALATSNNTFAVAFKSDITTSESYGQCLVGINDTSTVQRIGLRLNASAQGGSGADSMSFSSQSSFGSTNTCNIASAGVTDLSIAIGTRDGVNVTIYDGNGNTDTATTGANDTSVNRFSVGASTTTGTGDSFEFNGKMYECLAYDRALTAAEVKRVIQYFKNKWSII
tara:strand:+ start:6350 stop:10819 length:4470 start_codon:yes stop_codon:yes gene_type:complete